MGGDILRCDKMGVDILGQDDILRESDILWVDILWELTYHADYLLWGAYWNKMTY